MENDNIIITQLDIHNADDVALYETALYKAFSRTYIKSLSKIWMINHQQKIIKTIVEYDDQEIFIARRKNNILAAIAVNYNMHRSQLSLMNFSVDIQTCPYCEVLHLFSMLDFQGGSSILENISFLMFESLENKHIKKIYGTCSERRLNAYVIMGFEKIDDLIFFGEKKYLLEFDITKPVKSVKQL